MTDIVSKYRLLNKFAKQEVNDFMDFLLSKQKAKKQESFSTDKRKILSVSTWSDSDLKFIEKNQFLL